MAKRFHYERGREALGVFGGCAFAWLAWRGSELAAARGLGWGAAAAPLALAACGLAAALAYAAKLADRRPALEVGPTGLWAPRQMPEPLRWEAVEAVRLRVSHLRGIRIATLEIAGDGAAARLELLKLREPEREVLAAIEMHRPVARDPPPKP